MPMIWVLGSSNVYFHENYEKWLWRAGVPFQPWGVPRNWWKAG